MSSSSKARELADKQGEHVVALLLGHNITAKAGSLIAAGADRVIVADSPVLEHYLTESYTQAITAIVRDRKPGILMLGATTIGRDLGPRLSARNVTGLTADCTKMEIAEDNSFQMTPPAFGGNLRPHSHAKTTAPRLYRAPRR